ncbi:MAG: hypothetical protein R2827_08490 [Bdellovibrionales bacterium]
MNFGALAGGFCIVFLSFLHSIPHWIPGDIKYTQEGYKYGVGMIDANHQCQSITTFHYQNDTSHQRKYNSQEGQNRCPAFSFWFPLKRTCEKDPNIKKISWQFYHSINGGPFYEIVNVDNACQLEYKFLSHNEWINSPEFGAPIVGYPRPNLLYINNIRHNEEFVSDQPFDKPIATTQLFFKSHIKFFKFVYWTLWFAVLVFTVYKSVYYLCRRTP